MTLQVFGLVCGELIAPLEAFVAGRAGDVTAPVPAYLIVHPKGTAIFDTGMHVKAQTDPVAAFGRYLAGIFKPVFAPGDEVASRLNAIDHDPSRIDFLINSHLHFDHCGGNAQIPNATLIVQRAEWEAAHLPELAAKNGFKRRDFDLGHKVKEVNGEHDLFGDGSVVLIPTPGHTPGHQSLRLRSETGETVLTADCCYFHATLDDGELPAFGHDRDQHRRSLARLKAMRDAGAKLICGHDPLDWRDAKAGIRQIV